MAFFLVGGAWEVVLVGVAFAERAGDAFMPWDVLTFPGFLVSRNLVGAVVFGLLKGSGGCLRRVDFGGSVRSTTTGLAVSTFFGIERRGLVVTARGLDVSSFGIDRRGLVVTGLVACGELNGGSIVWVDGSDGASVGGSGVMNSV